MKKWKKILACTTVLLGITGPVWSAVPQTEKDALTALYDATGGDNWTDNSNWKTGDPCDNHWQGISCEGEGHITRIELERNNLTGSIPTQLQNLPNLNSLNLNGNHLGGSIPEELGNLTNLSQLRLAADQLEGNIPAALGNLTNLWQLDLAGNQLEGNIPAALGNLTNLTELILAYNNLTGNIPTELGNLTNIHMMILRQNQLTGNIPAELGNLVELTYLDLSHNQLTGNIPAEFGNLTKLKQISLAHNQLSGNIPTGLGKLADVIYMDFFNEWDAATETLNLRGIDLNGDPNQSSFYAVMKLVDSTPALRFRLIKADFDSTHGGGAYLSDTQKVNFRIVIDKPYEVSMDMEQDQQNNIYFTVESIEEQHYHER